MFLRICCTPGKSGVSCQERLPEPRQGGCQAVLGVAGQRLHLARQIGVTTRKCILRTLDQNLTRTALLAPALILLGVQPRLALGASLVGRSKFWPNLPNQAAVAAACQ